MPSKNNKKNKNNVDKKVVSGEKTAVKKKAAGKASADTKPHFFDKNIIDFSFAEKKSIDSSAFVSPEEASDNGFVAAHFYRSGEGAADEKTKTVSGAPVEAEKQASPALSEEKSSVSMSELLNRVASSEPAKPKKEESDIAQVLSQISAPSPKNEEVVPDIRMKDLLEKSVSGVSEDSDKEELGFDKEGAVFHRQLLDDIEAQSSDESKKEPYDKAVPIVINAVDSEARRENEAILASLTPADIKKSGEKEKKRKAVSVVRYAAMAVCLAVFVVSSINLVSGFFERSREKNKNDEFRDAFNSGEIGYTTLGYARQDTNLSPDERLYSDEGEIYKAPEPEVYDMHEKYVRMLPNLQALKYINSQAFAWIKVGGTRVDYPVVRSPQGDNDYYLSHGIDRTYSVSGAVFTDYNNSMKLSNNRNTCVYGHNMNDGTMFQTIMNFKEKNQFLNSTIEMYTAEGIYVYVPFAVYDAIPTESFFKTEFASDEDFTAFLFDIKSKSIFSKPGITLDKNSKVVTLITCTNTVTDKRFVVHGVLEEIVK